MGAGASKTLSAGPPVAPEAPLPLNPLSSTEVQWRHMSNLPPPPPLPADEPDLHGRNPRQRWMDAAAAEAVATPVNADFGRTSSAHQSAGTPTAGSTTHAPDMPVMHREGSPPPVAPADAAEALDPPSQAHDASFYPYRPPARSASPAAALGQYDELSLRKVQAEIHRNHKVFRVCLTGGPCAGKSTMLAQMQTKVPQRTGYQVLCVPEAATLLVTGGLQWDAALVVEQQLALLRTQLALEDQFYAIAVASGKPTIVLSDRGTMDGRAFCTDAQFTEILARLGCTLDALRDRYDEVIHMVTSAIGAEEFYNMDNPARYEDLSGARASDLKLREMYVGHPCFRLLDNSTSFENKIERGLRLINQLVGHDRPLQDTSYFLLRHCPQQVPVASVSYEVTTTVLSNSEVNEIRLLSQRAMADGSYMYFFNSIRQTNGRVSTDRRSCSRASPLTEVTLLRYGRQNPGSSPAYEAGQKVESEQRISSKEYRGLLRHRDTQREDVVVQATHFLFQSASVEVMTVVSPAWAAGKQIMSVECDPGTAELNLPAFAEVDRELPIDMNTAAYLIAHRETGPLYTSLAFAPVFLRSLAAIGPHADVENILRSTRSTPVQASSFRGEGGSRDGMASPVRSSRGQLDCLEAVQPTRQSAPRAGQGAPAALQARPASRLNSLNQNTKVVGEGAVGGRPAAHEEPSPLKKKPPVRSDPQDLADPAADKENQRQAPPSVSGHHHTLPLLTKPASKRVLIEKISPSSHETGGTASVA